MDFVRPIHFQGEKILLVDFGYILKMFQRKGNSSFLESIQREYDALDWMHILVFIGEMATITKSSGSCNLNYATENVAMLV